MPLAVAPGQALAGTPSNDGSNGTAVAWEEYEWNEVTYDKNSQVVSEKHGKGLLSEMPTGGVTIDAAEGGEGGSGTCKNVWARRIGHSALGFVVYKFEHWKNFCAASRPRGGSPRCTIRFSLRVWTTCWPTIATAGSRASWACGISTPSSRPG